MLSCSYLVLSFDSVSKKSKTEPPLKEYQMPRKTAKKKMTTTNYPPTTVQVNNACTLYRSQECTSSEFYSRKVGGYKLRLVLKSSNEKPTAQCPETKPNVQISILAHSQDDDELNGRTWPFNGTAKVKIQQSQQRDEFSDQISFKFSIDRPVNSIPRPLPLSLKWTPVPIPGTVTYHPPSSFECPSAIGSSIPDTINILVDKIIHRRK